MNKVDFLILLIGTNPLPNYISALALSKESSNILLIHTKEQQGLISSKKLAQNLKDVLLTKKPHLQINTLEIDKSKNEEIIGKGLAYVFKIIEDNFEDYERISIALDYTGSTKMLSALFYYGFKEFEKKHENWAMYYSYVNNEIGRIINFSTNAMEVSREFKDVDADNEVTIEDICKIHGFKIDSCDIKENDVLEDVKISSLYDANNIAYEFYKVIRKNFDLLFVGRSDKCAIGKCKLELFKLRNSAALIGGDKCYTYYLSNIPDKDNLLERLKSEYTECNIIQNEDLVQVFNNEESLEEEIEEFIY